MGSDAPCHTLFLSTEVFCPGSRQDSFLRRHVSDLDIYFVGSDGYHKDACGIGLDTQPYRSGRPLLC